MDMGRRSAFPQAWSKVSRLEQSGVARGGGLTRSETTVQFLEPALLGKLSFS